MTKEQREKLEQRKTVYQKMQDILDKAKAEKRSLTGDESDSFDQLEKEYDALTRDIDRLGKQEQRAVSQQSMATAPVIAGDMQNTRDDGGEYEAAYVRFLQQRATADDIHLLSTRALNTGVGSEGGYLVPEEWANEIFEKLDKVSDIRQDISIIRTSSTHNIPVDGDDIEFEWLDELEEYPELQPDFGTAKIGAKKAGGVVLISRELLADSAYDVKAHVIKKMVSGIQKSEHRAFVQGDGVKAPKGLMNAITNIVDSEATGISYNDLVNMKYAVPAQYRPTSKWRVSDAFLKAIDGMVDGNGRPIFVEGSIANGTPSTLLGYAVSYEPYLDDSIETDKKVAMFGNFKSYIGADRGEIYTQVLVEKYATKGAIGVVVDKRSDAALLDAEAIAILKIS